MSDTALTVDLDLEEELLEHLSVPESVMTLYRSRFQEDLIYDDTQQGALTKAAFQVAMEFVRKYHEAPPIDVLEQEVGKLICEEPQLPIEYVIEHFRKRYSKDQVLTTLTDLAQTAVENPAAVAQQAVAQFQQILRVSESRKDVLDITDADWLIDQYVENVAKGQMVGYTFGFKEVDQLLGGIRPGGLYFIIGRPKRYKSWFLLKSAVEAAKDGNRVCFFSLEMGVTEMMNRAMCMFAGTPWNLFVNGQLSDSHVQQMRDELALFSSGDNFTILHPPVGERDTSSLLRMAQDREADVVHVDQLKFIESPRATGKDARWQAVEYVCEDLKEASHTLPVYVACQFNREAANMTEMGDLSKIGLSDSIGQTADMLLGLYMNKEMKESRVVEFGTIESRSFEHARWLIPVHLNKNCNFGRPQQRTEDV
jgi:replicative DNA helicase